jgi:hypothetical protein
VKVPGCLCTTAHRSAAVVARLRRATQYPSALMNREALQYRATRSSPGGDGYHKQGIASEFSIPGIKFFRQ